jgi:anti-anti-sigma regulatory factor
MMSSDQSDPAETQDGEIECESLTIVVETTTHRAVIHAAGELDEVGGELLRRTVRSLAPQVRRVELDLSRVTGADLVGVRALDDARTAIEAAGAELVIHHADRAAYPIDWHCVPHSNRVGTVDGR